jgi:hypothetical protein
MNGSHGMITDQDDLYQTRRSWTFRFSERDGPLIPVRETRMSAILVSSLSVAPVLKQDWRKRYSEQPSASSFSASVPVMEMVMAMMAVGVGRLGLCRRTQAE